MTSDQDMSDLLTRLADRAAVDPVPDRVAAVHGRARKARLTRVGAATTASAVVLLAGVWAWSSLGGERHEPGLPAAGLPASDSAPSAPSAPSAASTASRSSGVSNAMTLPGMDVTLVRTSPVNAASVSVRPRRGLVPALVFAPAASGAVVPGGSDQGLYLSRLAWGDGTPGEGSDPGGQGCRGGTPLVEMNVSWRYTHTYARPGTYTVRLTVYFAASRSPRTG